MNNDDKIMILDVPVIDLGDPYDKINYTHSCLKEAKVRSGIKHVVE